MKIDIEAQRKALDSYNGWHEGPNNSNPFGPWQGVGNNQAWCDSSAQWGAVVGGGFDGWDAQCQCQHKGSAYCPYTIGDAQRIGLWRARGSGYVPQPGDQELYDWEGNGVADHIAGRYIARRPDGTHVTWEGNHNDQAGYVVRDDRYVVGWVALSAVATSQPTSEEDDLNADQDQRLTRIESRVSNIEQWVAGTKDSILSQIRAEVEAIKKQVGA